MLIGLQVASITLDELAAIMLPTRLIAAIDNTDVEYILWERRHSLTPIRNMRLFRPYHPRMSGHFRLSSSAIW